MDANVSAQLVLVLTQQNLKLMEEVASLKEELAKFQATKETKPKKSSKKSTDEPKESKPKNPSHVETGKRLVIWNANRKTMREAFVQWKSYKTTETEQ